MATTLTDVMVPASTTNTTTIEGKTPKSNPVIDQQQRNCANLEKTSNKQDQYQATSTTPRSSSSTNSTTSSGKAATNSANPGTTHTMGKFKEKRPEPLNLNPNLNQEIPLDLSVKSAGNMPSGRSVNTLETPRIFWLDNEALLIKPRLYSSSTSASQRIRLSSLAGDSPPITPNTPFMDLISSPTARSAADYHSHSASMLLDSNSSLQSLLSAQYQYSKHQQRQQFDDNLVAANKLTPTNRFLVHHFKDNNEIIRTPRRSCSTDNLSSLSCHGQLPNFKALQSYRSQQQQQQNNQRLSLQQNNPSADYKKNSISPLATKNLSSSKSGCNRFSYLGQQTENCNGDSTTRGHICTDDKVKGNSVTTNLVTDDQSQSSDNMTAGISGTGQALTPTSLANATANLLNIHLNSPTNQGPTFMEGLTSTIGSLTSINDLLATQKSSLAEYRSTDQNIDPLISAAYCQHHHHHQQNQILRSSLTSCSSSSFGGTENQDKQQNNSLASVYCQQSNLTGMLTNGFTSLSSSATLNTPTLVSPSQLKSGSSICFLPSPLSPMSSVFELPSPLLMFPPSTGSNQNLLPQVGFSGDHQTRINKACSPPFGAKLTPEPTTTKEDQQREPSRGRESREYGEKGQENAQCTSKSTTTTTTTATNQTCANREADLSLLVTSARDKLDVVDVDDEVSIDNMRMEIDTQDMISNSASLHVNHLREDQMVLLDNSQARPSTVIPRILVSDSCRLQQQQQRHQQHQHQSAQIHYREIHQRENQKPTYRDDIHPQQQQSEEVIGDMNNHNQAQSQYRVRRDMVDKRALSPQSQRARVSVYHSERLESSSAPPAVYQLRARSKIKCATEPCIVHGSEEQHLHQHQTDLCSRPPASNQLNPSPTHANYHNQHYKTNAPYPELQPHWLPVSQQQGLSIKTGFHRPSSAEPLSSQCSSGQHLGNSQHNFDATGAQANQYRHHTHQQLQPQQISSLGNISSHSEQHLRSDRIDMKPSMSGLIGQHQSHTVSVGELNRYPMNYGLFVGPATNNHQLSTVAFQQQQQHHHHHHHQQQQQTHAPLARHPVANNLLGSHNDHLQSAIVKIDDMINEPPRPIQIVPNLSSNQSTRGQGARFHECESKESPGQQLQPRALSAEVRGMTRSESSCSSVDFCFRSSSAASSATTAKKYQCDQCAKAFTRSDMLTRHKRLHSGDRPFQCNECKQEFSRSDHLSTHMRTHTGEKPYKCKLCSYSACRKDMITRHMKVHNRSSPNVQPMERS